jgi:hypothetical protein
LFNAAVEASNADVAAAADADDTEAAPSAVNASALALPVTPDDRDPDGGLIIMVWLIALLAPLMALIPVVLVGQAAFCREIAGGLSGNMGTEG